MQFDESLKAGHSGRPACEDMMGGLSYWDWIGLPDNKWRCAAAVGSCRRYCWYRHPLLTAPYFPLLCSQERFDAAMGVVQKLSVPAILQVGGQPVQVGGKLLNGGETRVNNAYSRAPCCMHVVVKLYSNALLSHLLAGLPLVPACQLYRDGRGRRAAWHPCCPAGAPPGHAGHPV